MFIELIRNDRNIANRFWSKVDRSKGDNECWHWTGAIDSPGYGAFKINNKKVNSHRVAYALAKDEWPIGGDVMHVCDNRLCCNPRHLKIGSRRENMRDAKERGRLALGENNSSSKLTEDQVRAIKQLSSNGSSAYAIAKAIGVSEHTILSIVSGQSWKHVQSIN